MTPLMIGGIDGHVHLLLGIPATMAVSGAVQLLKGGSSKWIHDAFEDEHLAFLRKHDIEFDERYVLD